MAAKKKTQVGAPSQADPRAPLDAAAFLSAAQRVLTVLRDDLLTRADESPGVTEALKAQWEVEKEAKRTGDPWEVWRRRVVVQIAAAWVLSLVFARTLEDRGLLERNRIAGPGATDSQEQFRGIAPYLSDRDYLLAVFGELSNLPAAEDLFNPKHNPIWKLGPSIAGARALLDLFRAPDPEAPAFRFGQSDTRFLGDLYQDLDEETQERFALLQTPQFIETYILDRTLERAIARFGLDQTTLIDPTCGSGHFLLGAFERLVDHRLREAPGLDVREAARRALNAVYGADINPYAVAIARFRLTLAFLDKGGYQRLADAPALSLHLVVADSLLHAPQQSHLGDVAGQSKEVWAGVEFALEDEAAAKDILLRNYAAVVGNPPYITVKDAVLRERYRDMYPHSAARQYSLAAPFTERFFLLARAGGYVGMITANSFMKRDFGTKLITEFLPRVNLDGVVDTSGAYIPKHDTPTVLLFGTHEAKQGSDVLAVLAKGGEPSTPSDPARGLVWLSIADHGGEVGFENDYISVTRMSRETLEKHPWSLGGGGAAELKALLEARTAIRLRDLVQEIGRSTHTGEDEAFFMPRHVAQRIAPDACVALVTGEQVRDWSITDAEWSLFPYDLQSAEPTPPHGAAEHAHYWRYRTTLRNRQDFGQQIEQRGLKWWEHSMFFPDRYRTHLSIAFASVATHNHFVLDRGVRVFKQSAPILVLKTASTETDHLALLAYLNSSTACFWMKQVCYPKATSNKDVGGIRGKEESNRFDFSGGALAAMPVPDFGKAREKLALLAAEMLQLAAERERRGPSLAVRTCRDPGGIWRALEADRDLQETLRGKLGALQREVDWLVYGLFGLPAEGTPPDRGAVSGHTEAVAMLESPVHVRPWAGRRGIFGHSVETFEQATLRACSELVVDTVERSIARRTEPEPRAGLSRDPEVAGELARIGDVVHRLGESSSTLVADALAGDSVPFLAAHRHTDSGLEKRGQWERVWDLQRAEDRGELVSPFDPPPKYDQKDYRDPTIWRLRGKLDVPKESFISYPGCESNEDKEPVYGWAGWTHLQQAIALATLYLKRKQGEAWGKDRLVPMLAGLDELLPWIWQWHPEPTPESGGMKPGQYIADFLGAQCQELGVTLDEVRAWRPESRRNIRASNKKGAPQQSGAAEEETP